MKKPRFVTGWEPVTARLLKVTVLVVGVVVLIVAAVVVVWWLSKNH